MKPTRDLGMGSPNQSEAELPVQQYTHSLKIEETAKGIRIAVHVYASDAITALEQAFDMYLASREVAAKENIPLAPIEVVKK